MEGNQLIIDCLNNIKERIASNILTKGEWASGKTAESMVVIPTERGGMLKGRPYFQSLEDGRPAGRVPYDFASIIRQWIIDKGIGVTPMPYKTNRPHKYTPADRGLNHMASAIAWSIKEHGTRLYQTGGRDDIYSDVIADEVEKLKRVLIYNTIQTIGKTLKTK